ncbi:unnamed protein product (macronuclear) [Paramecium tetraurelia]|uniref:Uncharacterized protein n=1 Tax=Paramecium tetraurelia TaxID=5888 RepID=A0CI51_PARTE|nr:uncharacterized protein GSPATT00038572001 [Paramecium tetraurelia]CAK70468.1 unnamed protein product [Paramecium tetraurelia]|eukprot:XP_001437865.1 hypothetical protein (macronuclear) [Paramecium tetraurelia strain d4-2]
MIKNQYLGDLNKKQLILENLDHLIDDQDLWENQRALRYCHLRKTFQLLTKQIDKNPTVRKVFGKFLKRSQIFARMKPEQKSQLNTDLQKISRIALCGMCGDGANDCGALKLQMLAYLYLKLKPLLLLHSHRKFKTFLDLLNY